MKPQITICVVSYQFDRFLDRCIQSLVTQTLQPAKIIICDDCSSDDSWNILQVWQNRFPDLITIQRPPERLGAAEIGRFLSFHINKCGGDYVSIIDGDDYWHIKKLELEYDAITQFTKADFAFSDVELTDENENPISYWKKHKSIPKGGNLFPYVLGRKYFDDTDSIFRNELISWRLFSCEGHTDTSLLNYWDWDRKIRFANKYIGVHTGETLVAYRQHPGGISKTFGQHNLFDAKIQVYEKHLPSIFSHSLSTQLYVQISFETRAAIQREQFGIIGHENYQYSNVYNRIVDKLKFLSEEQRTELSHIFSKEFKILNFGLLSHV